MTNPSPRLEDLIALNQEIAALVKAGIPLELGLKQSPSAWSSRFSLLSDRIAQRLSSGLSLAEALRQEGPTISPAYAAVVEAGLQAGRLPEAMESLADLGLTVKAIRQRIISCTIYPVIVCGLAYLLFIGFIVWGVPLWTSTREALFLPPRFVFSALEFLHQSVVIWGPLIPLGVVGFIVAEAFWLRSGSAGSWHQISYFLWVPGVSRLYCDLLRAQFTRLLSLLVEHQVPGDRAVTLAAESTGDVRLQIDALTIAEHLQRGATWPQAVSAATSLPPFLLWMMKVGEQQGALAEVLLQTANTYQRRADRWISWIQSLLPVALVVILCGSVVFLYCVLLFLPLQQFWLDLMQEPIGH